MKTLIVITTALTSLALAACNKPPTAQVSSNDSKTTPQQADAASTQNATDTKTVTVGAFTVAIPNSWTAFAASEAAALRSQYSEQSKQIYQQFSGGSDPSASVDLAAFHVADNTASFVIVSFTVPPQADLIKLLKTQIPEKMDFGVRQGYIRKYLGMTSIDDSQLSGFYTKAIGTKNNIEVSGGLEHKKLKNTVIQLTLLPPTSWDETKATSSLTAILKSVELKNK